MIREVTRREELLKGAQAMDKTFARPLLAKEPIAVAERVDSGQVVLDRQDVERAIARVREVLQNVGHLNIEVDQDLKRVIMKVVNSQTGEVIRQIPPEEVLNLARNLNGVKGLLVKEHV
ncbi:MAG: flagellar protein FlaG [Nitrospirota bacterium]